MLRLIDRLAGKWMDWRRFGIAREHGFDRDVRIEMAETSVGPDGRTLFQVLASLKGLDLFLEDAAAMLGHFEARNYLVFTMVARPDHTLRPVEVTLRWADKGLRPNEVVDILKVAMKASFRFGHNDDCLFCGMKDKFILDALQKVGDKDENGTPSD